MNSNPPESSPGAESVQERIRESAYFKWLDSGCTHGDDWSHWFAAQSEIMPGLDSPASADDKLAATAVKLTIRDTLDAHSSDPTHRFHAPGTAHDSRTDVIASGPRQRVRGRHFGGSLRPQQKKAK